MDLATASLLGILAVGLPLFVYGYRRMRNEKAARFRDRTELTPEEFYRRYYSSSGLPAAYIIRTLQEVADFLDVPPGKLRPQDRFAEELKPVRGWEYDDGLADVAWDLSRRAKQVGEAINLREVVTLDDYVKARVALDRPHL